MKAAIYTRLSLDREGETSTERQEEDCRAYAQAKGWEVGTVYRDRLSGYKEVHRPGFEAFMGELRSGSVDVGIVWKLDRLTRKGVTGIAPVLEALKSGNSSLVSVNDSIDTTTPMGKGVLAILASVAEQESANISLRTRRAKLQSAQAGSPGAGGRRPFGYEKGGLQVRESEAVLVREAARRVLAGESCHSVCNDWGERGVSAMRHNVIRTILLSARIRGLREHHGVRYPAQWPSIIDEETAQALDHVWAKRPVRKPPRRYLLGGIVRCGLCGGPCVPHQTGSRNGKPPVRRYACISVPGRKCGKATVGAERTEEWVERIMIAHMMDTSVLLAAPNDEAGPLIDEMADLRGRLDRLKDLYVAGDLPKGRYEAGRDDIVDRLGGLERRLESTGTLPEVADPEIAWKGWSLDLRRQAIRHVWGRILVEPGEVGRFKPGRLRFMDRDGAAWRIIEGEHGWELRPENPSDRRLLHLWV